MAERPLSILFDLDGTVVDSEPGILSSCKAALSALGHRPEGLDISGLIGPPLEEALAQILRQFGDDRVAEAVVAYREHYGSAGFLETTVYSGVAATLEHLSSLNTQFYIATSKRTVFATRILQHLGLIEKFVGVYGSEPGGAVDRKSDLIAHVLRRHDLNADHCLMVGDRRHDILGAKANDISAVGVLWGYGDRKELELAGASTIISQPTELAAIAGGWVL